MEQLKLNIPITEEEQKLQNEYDAEMIGHYIKELIYVENDKGGI